MPATFVVPEGSLSRKEREQISHTLRYALTAQAPSKQSETVEMKMPGYVEYAIKKWMREAKQPFPKTPQPPFSIQGILISTPESLPSAPSAPSAIGEGESQLLALPPELRNTIYRLVMVESDTIVATYNGTRPAIPPVLQTCRQIKDEGIDIYFQENEFEFRLNGSTWRGHGIDPHAPQDFFQEWCALSCHHRDARLFVTLENFAFKDVMHLVKAWQRGDAWWDDNWLNWEQRHGEGRALVATFNMVKSLVKKRDMDWSTIETAIRVMAEGADYWD